MYDVLGGKIMSSTMDLVFRFGKFSSFLFHSSWGV